MLCFIYINYICIKVFSQESFNLTVIVINDMMPLKILTQVKSGS